MLNCSFFFQLFLSVLALAASSASSGPLSMLQEDVRSSFSAMGIVRSAGANGSTLCSGALVARDLVVTSAHCIRTDAGVLHNVEFVAGINGGRFIASSGAFEVHQHPGWSNTSGRMRFCYDIAVVRLSRPISADKVEPLSLIPERHAVPKQGALVGYGGRSAMSALYGRFDCMFSGAANVGLFTSDCHATRGNSGGAVLTKSQNGWKLAGVIVATKRWTQKAVVTELDDWLRQHVRQALDREEVRLARLQ